MIIAHSSLAPLIKAHWSPRRRRWSLDFPAACSRALPSSGHPCQATRTASPPACENTVERGPHCRPCCGTEWGARRGPFAVDCRAADRGVQPMPRHDANPRALEAPRRSSTNDFDPLFTSDDWMSRSNCPSSAGAAARTRALWMLE
jgi:hypothetical protein